MFINIYPLNFILKRFSILEIEILLFRSKRNEIVSFSKSRSVEEHYSCKLIFMIF